MKIQRTAWAVAQAGIPVIIVGDNGIGKTTCALEFARILNLKAVKIALLGAAAEDLLGYPIIKEVEGSDGKTRKITEYARHTWLEEVENGAMLILEEIARLDNDRMQNIVAQLLDKSMGQYNIPKDTIIIGTTNVDDIAGINEINYNVLTRAAWYQAEVGLEEEKKALITGKYELEMQVKPLPKDWKKYIPSTRSHIGAFFTYRPSAFKRNDERTTTWPCPRTINMYLIPGLAAALSVGYTKLEDYEGVMTACCGTVFAESYVNWRSLYVNKEPKEIYMDIKNNDLDYSNGNIMLAYLTEVQTWMVSIEEIEYAKEVWQVCMNFIANRMLEHMPEISVYIAYSFMQAKNLIGRVPAALVKLLGDL